MLPAGGAPVQRSFRFTSAGTNGGFVNVVLQLQDGANNLGTATFTFGLPTLFSFSNTNAIVIRDNDKAFPYPSSITVSGISGVVGKVTATLVNASHSFPGDIDGLLVGPTGQKTILLSGAGAPPMANATITFDDGAPAIPDANGQIVTGAYHPASYIPGVILPPAAPVGPYAAAMSVFNNADSTGTWSLYLADHEAGDAGSVAGGWKLGFSVISPVNQLADLSLVATSFPNPALVGNLVTNVFILFNLGPNDASFVTFSDPLPVGSTLIDATSSRGQISTSSTLVTANIGPLSVGSSASVTVVLSVGSANAGLLANTASISSPETDLNPANNSAAATVTVVLPNADLSLASRLPPILWSLAVILH